MAHRTADHTTPVEMLDAKIESMIAVERQAQIDGRDSMSFLYGRGLAQLRMQRDINAAGGTLIKVLALLDGTPVQAEPITDGYGKTQWKTTKPVNGKRYFAYHPARASTLAKHGLQEVEAIVPTDVTLSQTYCPIDQPCYLKWGA